MATASQTTAIYNAVLQRNPTDAEQAAFVASSQTSPAEDQAIDLLVNSAEANEFVAPIVRLYQATFGRVPDAEGLNFWSDFLRDQSEAGVNTFDVLTTINAGFAASSEFATRFPEAADDGIVDETFLTALYQQTFGRDPSEADVDFYVGTQISETLSAFAQSSETIDMFDGYVDLFLTKAANNSQDYAGSLLDANDDNTVDQADMDLVNGDTGGADTFVLTTSADTATANVFEAPLETLSGVEGATTLNTSDNLTGSGDMPTLNATVTNAQGPLAPTLNGVSNINLTAIGGADVLVQLRNATGEMEINNNNSTDGLTVTNISLEEGTQLGVSNSGDFSTFVFDGSTLGGESDQVSISLDRVDQYITVGSDTTAGIEAVNIASNGSIPNVTDLTVAGATSATITGEADLSLTDFGGTGDALNGFGGAGLTSLNATEFSGDLSVLFSDGLDDGDVEVTGGSGDDTFSFQDGLSNDDSVVGGEGDDTVSVTNSGGTFIGSDDDGDVSVSGVETLRLVTNAGANPDSALDFDVFESTDDFTNVVIAGATAGGANVTLNDVNGISSFTVTQLDQDSVDETVGDVTINYSDDDSDTDEVTVNLVSTSDDGAFNVGNIAVNDDDGDDLETLNINAQIGVGVGGIPGDEDIVIGNISSTSADLDTLNITGDANLNVSGTVDATIETIDAEDFTGDLTITGSFTDGVDGTTILSGSGDDVLTGTTQNDTIEGNDGDDTILGGAGADTLSGGAGDDDITGGDGIDSIDVGEGGDDIVNLAGVLTTANRDIVENFEAGTDGDVVQIAAADTDAGTTAGDAPAYQVLNTGGDGTADITLSDVDIVEFAFDLTGSNIASGDNLLTALGYDATGTDGGTDDLQVDTSGDALYFVAYADGNAYLYYADEAGGGDADTALAGSDIALVGVFEDIAVGAFNADNFELV